MNRFWWVLILAVAPALADAQLNWALTADAQKIGLDVKEFAIPTNRTVALPPQVPKLTDIKVINYDFAKYGSSETRRRLLERWEREVNAAPK